MLEKAFNDVYTKFKLHFYQNVFQRFATREATLTTVESFCMEGIMAMGEPTIAEFSRMMQISTPNAAYKIGSLVRKGYVEKIQSTTDRREYHLRPTQKYIDYYNISYSYLSTVVQRVNKRFPKEDVKKLEQMLTIRGEAAACVPAASGNSDQQEILGEQLFGGLQRNVMHGPKGQRGVCPGPLGVGVQCWDL